MVSPHLKINAGSRSTGKSGVDRFRYICREGKYQGRNDLVSLTHHNYPAWAKDSPQDFWKAADTYERANARIYTELEIALPRELTQTQQTRLINDFVRQELGDKHPYTIGFHRSKALDGGLNPHVHLMFSERAFDGIERDEKQFFKRANSRHPERGGAAKNRDWSRRNKVAEFRNSWENAINLAFQRAGIDKVISLKSLAEQGIERIPEPKLGAAQTAMMRQGKHNDNTLLVQSLRSVRNIEASLGGVQKEITETIQDLARDVVKNSDRSVGIPANEIKTAVRDKKMDIYAKLREVEQERFSLGLMRTSGDEVYQTTDSPELQQKRDNTEKRYSKLLGELSAAKKYEKQLAVLGSEKIEITQGKSLSEGESLYDRPGFLQKVKEMKAQILEKSQSQQIQLVREIPPP